MTEPETLRKTFPVDVSDHSRFVPNRAAPIWWGIVGLILIELTVVTAFVVSYFYLRLMSEQWPPEGVAPLDLLNPSLALALLLASCVTMWWAGKAISRNKYNQFVVSIFASVTLAGLVLPLRWQQFQEFGFRWDDHAYGSIVWTITGFHFTHVVSAVIGTVVVGILGLKRYFNKDRQIAVVVDTLYWNFVAVAWIPFYLVLYWVPRLM